MWYNVRHTEIFDEVLEKDEAQDADGHEEMVREKLTLTETVIAIAISLACVCMSAVFLVQEIEAVVERGVSDNFMGLILVPLVEKAAEHLTAVDEAWYVCNFRIDVISIRFHTANPADIQGQSNQLCSLPLLGPFHPDCPFQRTSCRHCWLGAG